ncbi:hypothetical protein [Fibrella aquatilis]|uniref:T9SS type A sorting domain-containing protein n=1 Tax=Fibrella aquatilis TaxID=2817059 RepID=A0A939G725_9BACT|nr:hypothetical protein [Fibrella aquatilis]MBO0931575.1 hypothetical protein [Fibrella aquatilis]
MMHTTTFVSARCGHRYCIWAWLLVSWFYTAQTAHAQTTWAKNMGGTSIDQGNGIALDGSGNFVWAKRIGGTDSDIGFSIALNGSGNVYTTGHFAGTVDFDPGVGVANLTSTAVGSFDIFVSKLDGSGNFVWAKAMGGTGSDIGNAIAVDGSGNVHTTGPFTGTVDFDPGAGTSNLVSAGSRDIFVSKLDALGALPVTLRYFSGRMVAEGALLGWATASEINSSHFLLERSGDLQGFEAIAHVPSKAPNGNATTELTYQYVDAQPRPGVNYYRLVQVDRDGSRIPSKPIALSREGAAPVLFPNPMGPQGEAALEPAVAYRRYRLTNLLGQVVQQADEPGTLSRVSVVNQPLGLYLLHLEPTEGLPQTYRIVK